MSISFFNDNGYVAKLFVKATKTVHFKRKSNQKGAQQLTLSLLYINM
jgi:uncharacterized protein YqfB (UPF0267 family)